MNRREVLLRVAWLSGGFAGLAALGACAGAGDVPASVATDAGLIAAGLAGAFRELAPAEAGGAVPGGVVTALADLAAAAMALGGAEQVASPPLRKQGAQPLVRRIEADVNAVVAAVAGIPALPPAVFLALQAALVLLPVIEAAVGLLVPATSMSLRKQEAGKPAPAKAGGTMTAAEARAVLAGAAR